MTFLLSVGLVINLIAKAAQFERRMFEDTGNYTAMVAILAAAGILLGWRNTALSRSPEGAVQFEQEADPAILALDLNRDGVTPIGSGPGTSDPGSWPMRDRKG